MLPTRTEIYVPEPDETTQSAMLLTQKEWDDLAVICRFYRHTQPLGIVEDKARRDALCKRVEEAA